MKQKVIDATNLKLGRLASYAAKDLLKGTPMEIVNAEKAVILGRPKDIYDSYSEKQKIGSRYKGPFYPKEPRRIVKRAIRGMLPYKKERGKKAFKNVKVYKGVPKEFEGKTFETFEKAKISRIEKSKYVTVGDLSKKIGKND